MKILACTLLLMGAVGVANTGVVNAQAVGGVCASQGGSMNVQTTTHTPFTVTTVSNNGVGTTGTVVIPPSHVDTIPPIVTTPQSVPSHIESIPQPGTPQIPSTPPAVTPGPGPDMGPQQTPHETPDNNFTPTPAPPSDTPPPSRAHISPPGGQQYHYHYPTNYHPGDYHIYTPRHPRHYRMPTTGGDASMIPLLGLVVTGGMFGLRRRLLKGNKNS